MSFRPEVAAATEVEEPAVSLAQFRSLYTMITLDLPDTKTRTKPSLRPTGSHASAQFSPQRLPALRAFLRRARPAVGLAGEVSILLTTDRALRRLNREFRGKDKPTDVLSFPAANFPESNKTKAISGDLAISLDTAARQARSFHHSLEIELRILLLHGLLHLAGYDHEVDDGEMAEREEQLRRRFRLPTSLIARVQPSKSAHRRGRA